LETLTTILNSAPYGDEKVWNALRLAEALTSGAAKMKVNIYLLGDAETTGKRGQTPLQGYCNLEEILKELNDHGLDIMACRIFINARGLTQEDLLKEYRLEPR